MSYPNLTLVYNVRPAKEGIKNPPILLMLHGYGSHENDLFGFADELPNNFFVVSARAPISLGFGGFAWYEINFDQLGTGKMSNTEQATRSRELVRAFIKEIKETLALKNSEVWLMGFSQGCILSYGLSLSYPKEFGRVLALSGYVLKDIVPKQYLPEELKHLDYFISHGRQDQVLPLEWAQQTAHMLEQLKINHIYREYNMGHGVDPHCFGDMKKWIEERI